MTVFDFIHAMEVNRLKKDELLFEVGIRGFVPENGTISVDELRAKLRELRAKENAGESLESVLNLVVDDELTTVGLKMQEVDLGISDVQAGGETSVNRLRTLLSHLNARLSALLPQTKSWDRERVKQTCEELKLRVSSFRTLGDSSVYAASSVLTYSALRGAEPGATVPERFREIVLQRPNELQTSRNNDRDSSSEGESSSRPVRTHYGPRVVPNNGSDHGDGDQGRIRVNYNGDGKRIDFHKWHLKFSGDDGRSINSFLIDVEEKAETYGVGEGRLLSGISELLEGSAKLWYRLVKPDINSWTEFKRLIRGEYLPLDYTDNLWEEIRNRKQGDGELMGAFVSRIMGMFDRLGVEVSDEMKLDQIIKNLHPFYTERLSLTKVLSIKQLKEFGKQIEVSKYRIERYEQGPGSKGKQKSLEPELAFKPVKKASINVIESSVGENRERNKCWNCDKPGHRYSACRAPVKHKFCWVCGRRNVTKFKCPDCRATGRVQRKGEGEEDQGRGD